MVSLPELFTAESQPPVPIGLVTAPPGTGKTHATMVALAEHGTRALYVTPTHDLAMQIQDDLNTMGVTTHYWRQGPDDTDDCLHRDAVEFFRGLGYLIRLGPCQKCIKRNRCDYRKIFTCRANGEAQVLIVTSWHLRRGDLWCLTAMADRPLVILDEDALSAVAAPVELTVERLQNFVGNIQIVREALGGKQANVTVAWLARRMAKPLEGDEAALALTDIFRRMAENVLHACAKAGRGKWSPSETVADLHLTDYDHVLLNDNDVFDSLMQCAYDAVRHGTTFPNMVDDMRNLLLEPRPVHLSSGACRWTRASSIPRGRQVIVLDATAEPQVVEGVLGRPADIIDTAPVEQKATIYQVMDKIGTRSGNQSDLAREES